MALQFFLNLLYLYILIIEKQKYIITLKYTYNNNKKFNLI
jgi:hypothetical protein